MAIPNKKVKGSNKTPFNDSSSTETPSSGDQLLGTADYDAFEKLPEVCRFTKLSPTEIYRRIKKGTFEPPIKLGPKSSVWRRGKLIEWRDARIRESQDETIKS
jgi:predicted DNA-binding transcriptional regulator AlpA